MPVIAAVTALLGRAYRRRVDAEEELLLRELPGHTASCQHSKKIVPFIW